MVEVMARGTERRPRGRVVAAALDLAALGWPVVAAAHPLREGARACSCDRLGCPDPGAHPTSPGWQHQATTDPETIERRWAADPDANLILPTGRVFDVLDVPAAAGIAALARMASTGVRVGPVAAYDAQRYLFFVTTRGAPDDEDEWWSCRLDCVPETIADTPGLRWHCRDSYVLAAPSLLPSGNEVGWIRGPGRAPLPDPVPLLDVLADVCE
ncbi:MAG: DNA primase [Streptosporangiales bacterium]|nr:DNA primase [Streptosporangiales bacterium]